MLGMQALKRIGQPEDVTDCGDKTRARIPASSGLFALNRKISVYARLHGGGGSHRRTCLSDKFPGNREINREFRQIQPFAAIYASSQRAKSSAAPAAHVSRYPD